MESKYSVNTFVILLCLAQRIFSNAISYSKDEFEKHLNETMAETFERLNHLQAMNDFQSYEGTSFDIQIVQAVTNRVKQMRNELQDYYDNLKEKSLNSKTIPDMHKYMFEIKILDLSPKYIYLLYFDISKIIQNDPKLSIDNKRIAIREIRSIIDIFISLMIEKLKYEIENHHCEWQNLGVITTVQELNCNEKGKVNNYDTKQALQRFQNYLQNFKSRVTTHWNKIERILRT